MFTGIVEEVGKIEVLASDHLMISAQRVLEGLTLGDSIAVNGICLTVTSFTTRAFTADVMPETIRRTAFQNLKKGSLVNLERALTLQSRLGGHLVSGHIDGTGCLRSFREEGNAILMEVTAAPAILRYVVEKGSIAIDGISLTVASRAEDAFVVSLIPHTRQVTALKEKAPGDLLNLETDIIGKYVEQLLQPAEMEKESKTPITADFLAQCGF